MRPGLLGLALVASLAMALIGASVPRGVPPAVAMAQLEPFCGYEYDESGRRPIGPEECAYREEEAEREREFWEDERRAAEMEEEWQREFGPDLVTVEECSAPMVALFPLPEELGQALLLGDNRVTNGHCSDLAELTRFDEDPQQYAADLTALGWREHALQTYRYDRGTFPDIFISIDRFETAEGAAQALEYFTLRREEGALASLSPAVDRSLLAPNQSANVDRDDSSASLRQQDGTYVMRVRTLTDPIDGPSALNQALLVMDMVHTRWLAWNAANIRVGGAAGCDTNYAAVLFGGCVPADRDYDCGELRSWGIANIPVIGEDWMLLDDDGDGLGCEPIAQPVTLTPEPTKQCDGILGALGCLLGQ